MAVKKKRSAGKKAIPKKKRKATTKKPPAEKPEQPKAPNSLADRAAKMGRPTDFTPEVANLICMLMMEGFSLRRICAIPDAPCMSSVMVWLSKGASEEAGPYRDFMEQYARAREIQAEVFAHEIIDIADDGRNDTYEDDDGNVHVNNDVIQRSKLRVEARKWAAAQLSPRKYGKTSHLTVGHGGLTLEGVYTRIVEGGLTEGPGIVYDQPPALTHERADDSGPEGY